MIAQLFEQPNGLEWLRALATKQLLDLRRRNEEVVECGLERRQSAKHDVLVFDRYWNQRIRYKASYARTGVAHDTWIAARSSVE